MLAKKRENENETTQKYADMSLLLCHNNFNFKSNGIEPFVYFRDGTWIKTNVFRKFAL